MKLPAFFKPLPRLLPAFALPSPVPGRTTTDPGFARQFSFQSGIGGSGDEEPTVEAERRRQDDSSSAGNRERAEAPHRERSDQSAGGASGFGDTSGLGGGGAAQPPSGGGGGSWSPPPVSAPGAGTGTSAGLPSLPIIGVILLIVLCAGAFYLFQGGGTPSGPGQNSQNPSGSKTATSAPLPTATTASSFVPGTIPPRPTGAPGTGQTWTVMLYQDADDKALEQDIDFDLNEAERVGSNDKVQIVSQIDRYRAGFSGDGNWVGARRYLVTKDNDLSTVHSQQLADLGQVDMSDPNTLVDFATWAMKSYPADKYVLILSDHGMGWPGGFTSTAQRGRALPDAPLADAMGNLMYLSDIDSALGKIRTNTGLDKFEMVGLDACLMGGLEVLDTLAPHARYAVLSEETEPSLGYAYAGFLGSLEANPSMNGGDLARAVVQSYITDDQRVVDDQARAELVRGGPVMGGLFGGAPSAAQVSQQLSADVTLSAADLSAVPQLMDAVNNMAFDFQQVDQSVLARARDYAHSFTNVFGNSSPSPYIDLGNFVQLLQSAKPQGDLANAINSVQAGIGKVVIGEKHGPQEAGATGISIYFPNSQLYASPEAGPQSYTKIASHFATDSVWDNFLAFHYTGRKFDKAPAVVAVPQSGEKIVPPAAGVQVSAMRASAKQVSIGQSITLSAEITGTNVGYIKFFTGYYDASANSIAVVDNDYLQSKTTRQVGGVYFPDWGTSAKFNLQFQWEPVVFGLTDGTRTVQTLLNPDTYGASSQEAVYTVDGMYTFTNGGEQRYARMFFKNGTLQSVIGFTGQNGTGAASQITPQQGDKFTIYQQWLDLDAQGNVQQTVNQAGDTLTFGSQTFKWKELDAAAGQYVVGFLVEDLDGNTYPSYAAVTVR